MKFQIFLIDATESRSSQTDNSNRGTIRSHRPEQVFLRVGFVVLHIQLGYTGVIIGWRVSDVSSLTEIRMIMLFFPLFILIY